MHVKGVEPLHAAPTGRAASVGARALNVAPQAALNPPRENAAAVERFGLTYWIGDEVIQTENNYDRDVFNGDLGSITAIEWRRRVSLLVK